MQPIIKLENRWIIKVLYRIAIHGEKNPKNHWNYLLSHKTAGFQVAQRESLKI